MLVPRANWENPVHRRVMAVQAIQERDVEALLEFHAAFLTLKGRKRARVSGRTLRIYQSGILDFHEWVWPEGTPAPRFLLHRATADQVDAWVKALEEHGGHRSRPGQRKPLQPQSVEALLKGVRSLFLAFAWAGLAQPLNVAAPKDPTPPEERRPALPQSLYRELLGRLEGDSIENRREHLAARLMGEAGLRVSELIGLDLVDIQLQERLIRLEGKGKKKRTVPLSQSLAAELGDWLLLRQAHAKAGEQAVLVNLGGRKADGRRMTDKSLRRRFQAHYEALGFNERYYGVHMLRHTAGTRWYKISKDLFATSRLLGHASVNTSAIYAKMDLEGLREVVEKADLDRPRPT